MSVEASELRKMLTRNRVWKSFFRHGFPDNSRNQSLLIMSNVFLHLHPVKVRRHGLKLTYTFGLGGLSVLLFLLLVVTGGLLMFHYIPSTDQAYDSVKDLQFAVSFGSLFRNLHRWAAHLMVLVVVLHMCRVFLTGSYKQPREFNWCIGVLLFILTLAFSFTGYLLPWDQLAYWAITVGTNMVRAAPLVGDQIRFVLLGGESVGQNALIRFYNLHVFVLPGITLGLLAMHFWRIRKDGGISGAEVKHNHAEASGGESDHRDLKTYDLMALVEGDSLLVDKEPEDTEMTFPHLVLREATVAVAATAFLLAISLFLNAPLEEIANPTKTPNPAKAPWYFLGLQEMVSWSSPFWGGVLVPFVVTIGLLAIPYIDWNRRGVGVLFSRERKLAISLFVIFVLYMGTLILIGYFFRGPGWHLHWPWQPVGH